MRISREFWATVILAVSCFGLAPGAKAAGGKGRTPKLAVGDGPPVDVVFAIDCSGSMGPVIETAKQKVWDIVNEVARAKPAPHLRIGLFGYGNGAGSYRKFDLSDDLDTVYGNLMTFKDEGWSDEYVGLAIDKVLGEMGWSKPGSGGASLRVIYVVGNETAQQGPVDYAVAAKKALTSDIFVNGIYCGNEGGQDTWQKMAAAGGGKYLEIAGDGGSVSIPTPYDGQLTALNTKLNGTYLAFGTRGTMASANQAAQDENAKAVGGAPTVAARAVAKASSQYRNSNWDLVDAVRDNKVDLDKLKDEELPEDLRKLTPEQRKAKVTQASKDRAQVQKEILEIDKKRQGYIAAEMKKRGQDHSLDNAVRQLVRAQAADRGFKFEDAK